MGLYFEDWLVDWQDKQNACKGYYLFTAFEKFKLCYYLVYLLDFVELCNNGFRDQYYENLISVLKLDKNKCPKLVKFPSKDERYEYELKFKKELRLILKECCVKYAKQAQKRKTPLENKLEIICNLYLLDDVEKGYLTYYVLMEVNSLIGG